MPREDKYFQTYNEEELWQRYCGFFDFSVDEFLQTQRQLLMKQIDAIYNSTLGKRIIGSTKPASVEEFRNVVPLTKYEDYEPYLSEKNEDVLAVKPVAWCHSSGKGGKFKWLPYSEEALEVVARLFVAYIILSTANRRGEVKVGPGERTVISLAPRPYASGTFTYYVSKAFTLRFMPPLEKAEQMDFKDRTQLGFQLALRNGVDLIGSLSSVMVKVGERMAEQAQGLTLSKSMLHPRILVTLLKAWISSKINKRPMLPKDLWTPKGIITSGTDTSIYKDAVIYYWGRTPYELIGAAEAPTIALQNWNKKWLTFIPYSAFWEFIPEDENAKWKNDKSYKPQTVLFDDLEEGQLYEVVMTQFYGMPLLRYRIGDIIRVVALKDEETGTKLPQIIFHARAGETIDLAGLASLNERVIWQAIANTEMRYEDWSAFKEYDNNKAFLRIYIELKESRDVAQVERQIHEQLKIIDVDYRDIDSWLELEPVRVTLLSSGTFERYYQEKVAEGADLAHLKPPHINAPNEVIQRLYQLGQ